jgi:hypothetical protein
MLNESDDICRDDLADRRSFIRLTVAVLATILTRASEAQPAEHVGSVADLKGQAFAERQSCGANLAVRHRYLYATKSAPGRTRG